MADDIVLSCSSTSAFSDSSVCRATWLKASKRSWMRVSKAVAFSAAAWRDLAVSSASVRSTVESSSRKVARVCVASARPAAASLLAWPRWVSSACEDS
ncbi:hypothetical protein J2X16_004858 [Pelomonas aquatica]|uniref:Uncharacterized protein n=1 Tax=Pelomonas aquatica TaxID=431058 RepID=A0ABU1ZFX6_9BURK|nr:hypothetical protein [Pelomonas aquatica]MDR7299488.1 hypothetical protein [Pelomonas aquatica]